MTMRQFIPSHPQFLCNYGVYSIWVAAVHPSPPRDALPPATSQMTAPPREDRRHGPDLQGIPLRGILIGAALSLVLSVCDTYATNVIRGSYLTLNFSTPAALFFIFFLILASGVVGLLHRWLALTRSELVTIYIMLVVACCIPGMGFTQFMIPCLLGSTYYATPENDWDGVYNQYIPEWMIPRGNEVARYFFEGLPEGASIPWEPGSCL